MNYLQLLSKYKDLLKENKELKKIILDIKPSYFASSTLKHKAIDKQTPIKSISQKPSIVQVDNKSSSDDKIKLFKSLFIGRSDVYAKYWHSNSTNRSGYVPDCLNEWQRPMCKKPNVKCSACSNRELVPFSDKTIEKHLRGEILVGIYPMLDNETCKFLVIDFNDSNWINDVSVIRETCNHFNIPHSIEISKSGNGAHIWFFFEDFIKATLARKFGSAILTYSTTKKHDISFSSYDRLFPNQDTIPTGGFGKLIALPLQKKAREMGFSQFVDNNLLPYHDQWTYLSSIEKIQTIKINSMILDLCGKNELGFYNNIDSHKPWEKKSSDYNYSVSDFPKSIKIKKSNMLYIEKTGVSEKALDLFKRLSVFNNPEFYKHQAMKLSTYSKPRLIDFSDESEKHLGIPRGCEDKLRNVCERFNINTIIDEKYNSGKSIPVDFNGSLREHQSIARKELLKHNNGVLSATTAFGKTVVAANIIASLKTNTLILVHSRQLLEQWKERLNQFLVFHESLYDNIKVRGRKKEKHIVGQLGGGKNTLNGLVDIAIMQSINRKNTINNIVKDYGLVIVDECHHIPAFSFESILKEVNAKYVYGLTATPVRKDGHHPIIFMQCGPIRYNVDAKSEANKRPFNHYIVPKFTPFKLANNEKAKTLNIASLFTELCQNESRNKLIYKDIIQANQEGRNSIVITERTEHLDLLYEHLIDKIDNIIKLSGQLTKKQRDLAIDKLKSIQDTNFTILATGRYIGEGFDEPRLDTLFLTMPVSWKGTIAQYAGRLHRLVENKKDVIIYDYVDIHIGVLDKMYQKRLKGYAAIGYTVKNSTPNLNFNAIYNQDSFYELFRSDLSSAKTSIIIVSPFTSKIRLLKFMPLFKSVIENQIQLIIVTRPKENFNGKELLTFDDKVQALKNLGAKVIFKDMIHQKFAIIDYNIVWYGSINLLSYGRSKESVIRLEDSNVASELYEIVL